MSPGTSRVSASGYRASEHKILRQVRLAKRFAILALSVAVATTCTEPTDLNNVSLIISTDRLHYKPSDLVIVSTHSAATQTIFDDHCAGALQHLQADGTWYRQAVVERHCPEDRPRAGRDRIPILPGTVHLDTFRLGRRHFPGTWRVELQIRNRKGALFPLDQTVSNTFTVEQSRDPVR